MVSVAQGAVDSAREAVKGLLTDTATAYSFITTRGSGSTVVPTERLEGERKTLKTTKLDKPVRDFVAGIEITSVAWQVKLAWDATIDKGWELRYADGLVLRVEAVMDKRTNQLFTVAVCGEAQ